MVNTFNISRFGGTPPSSDDVADSNRRIQDGPIYSREDILQILSEETIRPITRRCIRDTQALEFDASGLTLLIEESLENGIYIGSEWCSTGSPGSWAACDAYSLQRLEWIPNCGKNMNCNYYVKFAISSSGDVLLLLSCHTST